MLRWVRGRTDGGGGGAVGCRRKGQEVEVKREQHVSIVPQQVQRVPLTFDSTRHTSPTSTSTTTTLPFVRQRWRYLQDERLRAAKALCGEANQQPPSCDLSNTPSPPPPPATPPYTSSKRCGVSDPNLQRAKRKAKRRAWGGWRREEEGGGGGGGAVKEIISGGGSSQRCSKKEEEEVGVGL